jgi:hypothetical protein
MRESRYVRLATMLTEMDADRNATNLYDNDDTKFKLLLILILIY